MYLRRIELQGFKTFPRRSVLDLPPGVTAIVGPNGAGKSNLADAVRWALGDQSPRGLRIRRWEELIFAGSQTRPRTGMAEVLLTFDNSEGWLPTPFDEVVVGRRLFRSGETEYTLNGARVRLRDILDLLSAGGASNGGGSIVSQGQIDRVLLQRPEERRAFLEEAAGVARFYARRDQAQQRLAATRRNLERLRDLVAEAAPRLETLRQQAHVAQRGRTLSDELQATQAELVRQRLFTVTGQLREAEEREQEAAEALAVMLTEPAERLRQMAAEADLGAREIDAKLRAARGDLDRSRAAAAELHTRRTLLAERQTNLTARLAQTRSRVPPLESDREALANEIAQAAAQVDEIAAQTADCRQEREALLAALAPTRARASELAAARSALDDARDTLARLRERELHIAAERERAAAELDSLVAETRVNRQRADAAAAVVTRAAAHADQALQALDDAAEAQARAAALLLEVHDELGTARGREAALAQRVASLRDERRALRGLQNEAGVPAHAFRALRASPVGDSLLGRLRDWVHAGDSQTQLMLQAAFAGALDDVLVNDPADAVAARTAIEQLSLGRIRLRPGLHSPRWSPEAPDPPTLGNDLLGTLADFVNFTPHAPDAVRRLLRAVLVVRDLPAAIRVRRAASGLPVRIVTTQGDAIDLDGVIGVGRLGEGMASVLERLDRLAESIERSETELAAVRAELPALDERAARARRGVQAAERDLAAAKEAHHAAHAAAGESTRRHQHADARVSADVGHQQSVRERARELEERHSATRVELTGVQARVQRLQACLPGPLEEDRGEAEFSRRLAVIEATLAANGERGAALGAQRKALVARRARVADELEQTQSAARELERARESSRTEAAQVSAEAAHADDALEAASSAARDLEPAAIEARMEVQRLQLHANQRQWQQRHAERELNTARLETERLAARRDELRRYAREELSLQDVTPARSSRPVGELERRAARLRRLVATLGPMNPLAPDEYRRERERIDEAKTQIEDLQAGERNLRNLAADLQRQLRDEFLATFNRINAEFARVFREMFRGGEASMRLTAPDDLEGTGVEISVRIPGRRRQELAALSGGERALVGGALVLALLAARPRPFCVLDEVDAALDEENVIRFCEQLAALSDRTQFVVITHNAITVQAAATIYGVTMAEEGVSQLLSLSVNGHADGGGANGRQDAGRAAMQAARTSV